MTSALLERPALAAPATAPKPTEAEQTLVDAAYPMAFADWDARYAAYVGGDIVHKMAWWAVGCKFARSTLPALLLYANQVPGTRKKEPMDVDKTVEIWTDVLVGLSTAHSHAGYTAADHGTDEMLGPLLTAPVAQIREFAQKLAKRLEDDPRVPFMVWSGFRRVLEPLIVKGPDGPIIELKKRLATEIAEKVEKGLDRAELVDAIAGALQWRGEKTLEAVNTALDKGQKPRVRGRESCLFLDVGEETVVL